MKAIILANNRVGLEGVRVLRSGGVDIVGLVVHPPERALYREEIIEAAGITETNLFEGTELRDAGVLRHIESLEPDIGFSIFFGYILREEFFNQCPRGVLNLHPALLPWNRGTHPNIWSIVEQTPAGATLHFIDASVDTGDIVAQKEVPVKLWDTGKTLYARLEDACIDLLRDMLPDIIDGTMKRSPQPEGGSYHRARDLEDIDHIDLERQYKAIDLINLIRARTFPPHTGAYITDSYGRKINLRLDLEPETHEGDQPTEEGQV